MRLLKPSWVSHDGKPIFSIDIHPDGSRFATGGQGDNAGRIVVWNMAPVREEKDETNKNVPKMLCQMDQHLACVNCVRWNNNGKYLASGGDDKLVMVWQTSRYTGATSIFGSEKVNQEQWRCVHTLRGHSGDVLDVAWSPQDNLLASCSIDNTVVVWNASKLPEQVAVLKGHTGMVKGVTWDPIGKYLSSQSDDKSLRIWRTLDWQQEKSVTEPFMECGGTTHVLRLGWSPDGNYLVSAHAMNNSGPTAQIIERDGWKVAMDFVGHRKAVTVVRFNPNILSKKIKKNSEKAQQYSCCAIGSRDRSISIWLTALKRPLVVTHDLFSNSILDISWSKTGLELLCCSWDGTVAFLDFSTDEIGTPLTEEERSQLLQRRYGKSFAMTTASNTASQIIETTALLKLQQEKDKPKPSPTTPPGLTNGTSVRPQDASSTTTLARVGPDTSDNLSVSSVSGSPNKQIETKTQDGRRRITPIFLAPQPALGEVPLPFCVSGQSTSSLQENDVMFTSTKEQSKIVIERKDITTPSPKQNASKFSSMTTPGNISALYDTSPIQPMTGMSALKAPVNGTTTTKSTPKPADTSATTTSIASTTKLDKTAELEKSRLSVKRRLEEEPAAAVPIQPPVKKKDGRGRPRKYPLPDQVKPAPAPAPQPVIEKPPQIIYKTADLELPVPSIDSIVSIQISGSVGSQSALVVEVENFVTPSLHMLRCMQGGKMVWDAVHSSKVIAVAGNSHVVCSTCADHCMLLVSATTGRRLLPPLVLDSAISELRCSGYYVMAITSKGTVSIWNIQSLTAVIKSESLLPIMPNNSVKLLSSLLTEQGLPVISLTTGKSYTYKVDLGTWVLLSNKKDKLQACSDHQTCLPANTDNSGNMGPLATLQSNSQRPGSQAMSMFQSNPSLQQPSTLSHLENQVACSLALQSAHEYHFWLLTYVRYLVMQGQEQKLREVCDELLGPMYRSRAQPKWQQTVLGHNKRALLGEILPVIGSNLSLQRLFTEYQEQLDTVST